MDARRTETTCVTPTCVAPRHVDASRGFYFYFLRMSSAGGGGGVALPDFYFILFFSLLSRKIRAHLGLVMGEKMSKRLGGVKGCKKYKTSSWHLNRFLDADSIGSTV